MANLVIESVGEFSPRVGMDVYYFAYGTPNGEFPQGVERAAKITEVDEPGNKESSVGLCVMNPTGLFFNQHIPYGPTKPGHWVWMWDETATRPKEVLTNANA